MADGCSWFVQFCDVCFCFSLAVKGLRVYRQSLEMLSTAIVGGAIITYLQGYIKDISNWGDCFPDSRDLLSFIFLYGYKFYKLKGR